MTVQTGSIVISDLLNTAAKLRQTDDWELFRPGVTAHWLYKDQHTGAAAVLLRYEPGARVALHEHLGFEHMLVLAGDQYDEDGVYPQGSFTIHPPGSQHSPGSHGGCVALLIYEKGVRFVSPLGAPLD
ncbi:MAG: cupin domain-containing protein [Pirellulales bacterium]